MDDNGFSPWEAGVCASVLQCDWKFIGGVAYVECKEQMQWTVIGCGRGDC